MNAGLLSSWRDGPTRQAIVVFVQRTCGEDGSVAVPVGHGRERTEPAARLSEIRGEEVDTELSGTAGHRVWGQHRRLS